MKAGLGEQQESSGQRAGKSISGRKNSMCKGRGVWKHLVCSGIYGNQGARVGVWAVG